MPKRYGRITGWGKYAPERVMTNHELEQMVETSDEWIRTRTGIHERHIASDKEQLSDLAVGCSRRAMEVAGIRPEDIDLIILASSTPDYFVPPASSIVQEKLGAECGAFTLVAGCTGFVYALSVANQFIETGAYDTILVIGAELLSRNIDWEDRTTCVLFGDGAGAVVVQASDEPTGLLSFELGSDGAGGEHLIAPGYGTAKPLSQEVLANREQYLRMNGREVFKFASRVLGKSLRRVLHDADLTADEIDLFIPHQANYRIMEAAARLMRVSEDKFYMNIQRYGNTSAASIPIALTEAIEEGRAKMGDMLAFVAFGAGLTWGSAVVHLAGPDETTRGRALARNFVLLGKARRLMRRMASNIQEAASDVIIAVGQRFNLL